MSSLLLQPAPVTWVGYLMILAPIGCMFIPRQTLVNRLGILIPLPALLRGAFSSFPISRLGMPVSPKPQFRNRTSHKQPLQRLNDKLARFLARRRTNQRFADKCVPNLEIGNEGKLLAPASRSAALLRRFWLLLFGWNLSFSCPSVLAGGLSGRALFAPEFLVEKYFLDPNNTLLKLLWIEANPLFWGCFMTMLFLTVSTAALPLRWIASHHSWWTPFPLLVGVAGAIVRLYAILKPTFFIHFARVELLNFEAFLLLLSGILFSALTLLVIRLRLRKTLTDS